MHNSKFTSECVYQYFQFINHDFWIVLEYFQMMCNYYFRKIFIFINIDLNLNILLILYQLEIVFIYFIIFHLLVFKIYHYKN